MGEEVIGSRLQSSNYHVKFFILSIMLWSLWTTRNKTGVEKRFPRPSNDFFPQNYFFPIQWKIVLEEGDVKFLKDNQLYGK